MSVPECEVVAIIQTVPKNSSEVAAPLPRGDEFQMRVIDALAERARSGN